MPVLIHKKEMTFAAKMTQLAYMNKIDISRFADDPIEIEVISFNIVI